MYEHLHTYSISYYSKDPFINLLSGYLEKVQSNPKPVSLVFKKLIHCVPCFHTCAAGEEHGSRVGAVQATSRVTDASGCGW